MTDTAIEFNPALCIPAPTSETKYGPIKGILWLIFFAAGVASVIGNILIRATFLPGATSSNFHQVAMLGFALHMIGPVFAAGAVALSPRVKILHALSVLVLAIAVAFTLILIFTGIFTITHTR
jgi:hypothetical protein